MEFCYKYEDGGAGRAYQLQFTTERLHLSTKSKYCALLVHNQFVSYTEGEKNYSPLFKEAVKLSEEHHYKLVVNLNCWDLLSLMEADYVDDELLIEICFGPQPMQSVEAGSQNGLSDDEVE